mgnify:CR=1 FL=1
MSRGLGDVYKRQVLNGPPAVVIALNFKLLTKSMVNFPREPVPATLSSSTGSPGYGLLGSSGSTGETALSSSEGVISTCTYDCVVAACVAINQPQLLMMRQPITVINNRPVTNNPFFIGHTSVLLWRINWLARGVT